MKFFLTVSKMVIFIIIFLSSCSVIIPKLAKFESDECDNQIFTSSKEMMLCEFRDADGVHNLKYPISKYNIFAIDDYLKYYIRYTNSYHFKEIKLYPKNTKFKILNRYRTLRGDWEVDSTNMDYYLVQPLNENIKIWIAKFELGDFNLSCVKDRGYSNLKNVIWLGEELSPFGKDEYLTKVSDDYLINYPENIRDIFFDKNKSYMIDLEKGIKEFILIDNKPKIVKTYPLTKQISKFININDNLLYAKKYIGENEIIIFDISNNFSFLNEFSIEVSPINKITSLKKIFKHNYVYVNDLLLSKDEKILYMANGKNGIHILDVSNLKKINEIAIIDANNTEAISLSDDEKYLFSIGFYWENKKILKRTLSKFDISNIKKPFLTSFTNLKDNFYETRFVGLNTPQNMTIYNKKIFIANINSIQIYDLNLNFIKKIKFDGEIYNFKLNDNKLFIANGSNSLKVIEMNPSNFLP